MLALEKARRLGHNFVGTEQIILGLIGEGTGIPAKMLKNMGVNLKEARVEVEKIISACRQLFVHNGEQLLLSDQLVGKIELCFLTSLVWYAGTEATGS